MTPFSAQGGFFCGACKKMGCDEPVGALLGRKHGQVGEWRKENGLWVCDRDAYVGVEGMGGTSDEEESGEGGEDDGDGDGGGSDEDQVDEDYSEEEEALDPDEEGEGSED